MKIAIHGTNGGYRQIWPDESRESGLFDARSDVDREMAVGQSLYAVHFDDSSSESRVIFSKYVIIRDVIEGGSRRTGNIAFCAIVPAKRKLAGTDVKDLLDNLAETFSQKHLKGGGNLVGRISDDWAFVNELETQYSGLVKYGEGVSGVTAGTRPAAYVYYSDENELQKFFDAAPQQKEYSDYAQVFFVEKGFKGGNNNPLDALKHSEENDLTGKMKPFSQPKPKQGDTVAAVSWGNIGAQSQAAPEKPAVRPAAREPVTNAGPGVSAPAPRPAAPKPVSPADTGQNSVYHSSNGKSGAWSSGSEDSPKPGIGVLHIVAGVAAAAVLAAVGFFLLPNAQSSGKKEAARAAVITDSVNVLIPRVYSLSDAAVKYAEGDSLFSDTLFLYNERLNAGLKQLTDYRDTLETLERALKNKIVPDSLTEKFSRCTSYANSALGSTVQAQKKRGFINSLDFDSLKTLSYPGRFQELFGETATKLNRDKYDLVKKGLEKDNVDVSKITLTEMADRLVKYTASATTGGQSGRPGSAAPARSPLDVEILAYLKGGELKQVKLKEYLQKTTASDIQQSIKLCLEFWKLNADDAAQDNNKTYKAFLEKVIKNRHFDGSSLRCFLETPGINYAPGTKEKGLKQCAVTNK